VEHSYKDYTEYLKNIVQEHQRLLNVSEKYRNVSLWTAWIIMIGHVLLTIKIEIPTLVHFIGMGMVLQCIFFYFMQKRERELLRLNITLANSLIINLTRLYNSTEALKQSVEIINTLKRILYDKHGDI
jgi:hypothetical protein